MSRTFPPAKAAVVVLPLLIGGCGAVVGAGAAAGAYEYKQKEQMEKLDQDYAAGNISREEYRRRKEMIEEGSIIY